MIATAGFSSSAATHSTSQATATAPSSFFQTTQTHTSNSLVDQFNALARHNRTPASTSPAAQSLSAAAPRGAHYDGGSRYDDALVGKVPAERKTVASSSAVMQHIAKFLLYIMDFPENIKFCKSLQTVDFSSNPLSRLIMLEEADLSPVKRPTLVTTGICHDRDFDVLHLPSHGI